MMECKILENIKNRLSIHPIDWLIHFGGNLLFTYYAASGWPAYLVYDIVIEYEQKYQVWYKNLTWKEYLIKHSLGDIIADVFGILAGLIIRGLYNG